MAAEITHHAFNIPGLHINPLEKDLLETSNAYNNLVDDHDQPDVSQEHLDDLAKIFARYNVQSLFGLHLIHGHLKIDEDKIMLGRQFAQHGGIWTTPTKISEIDPSNIHGHIFLLTPDGRFVAYEYHEGARIDVSSVDPTFFEELIEYLQVNSLTSLLGLQVLTEKPRQMFEFVLHDIGTVMLYEADMKSGGISRVTGYHCELDNEKPRFKVLDSHSKTTKGTHRVFVSSPLPDVAALEKVLKQEEISR